MFTFSNIKFDSIFVKEGFNGQCGIFFVINAYVLIYVSYITLYKSKAFDFILYFNPATTLNQYQSKKIYSLGLYKCNGQI